MTAALKSARRCRQQGTDPLLLEWLFDLWVVDGLKAYAKTRNAFRELCELAALADETYTHYRSRRGDVRKAGVTAERFWNFHVLSANHIVAEDPVVAMYRLISLRKWDEDWTRRATEVAKHFMWIDDDTNHTDD